MSKLTGWKRINTKQITDSLSESKRKPNQRPSMIQKQHFPGRIIGLCGLFLVLPLAAQITVMNSSFEFNFSEAWPHYGSVDEWDGGSGTNLQEGPFHNGGTPIPDQSQVVFLQGSRTLTQEVFGLTPGQTHWIQFYYDARGCCGGTIDLEVKWDDVSLDQISNIKPSTDGNPYKFRNVAFVPEFDGGFLAFETTASGDATLNLDAVSFVIRSEGEVPVMNPSFEASGETLDPDGIISPAHMAGWVGEGTYGVSLDGVGTFADNGRSSEPEYVGFINGIGSLSQRLDNLVVGNTYSLSFEYNARSGDQPDLEVLLDGESLFKASVSAVGGSNPYRKGALSFVADNMQKQLQFLQTQEGDHTLLLDALHLEGEVGASFPPVSVFPTALELGPGEKAAVTVTVPEAYLAIQSADVALSSPNGGIASLVGAGEDGFLRLSFGQGGESTQTFEVLGKGRGSLRLLITPPTGLEMANDTAINVISSFIKNASFESNEAPDGIGVGAIVSWNGGSGLNQAKGPFHDNGLIPDRRQVAFIQGSGSLSQSIQGLNPGQTYWLQFYYNARNCCGGSLGASVRFGGEELWSVEEILPSVEEGLETYYFQNVVFEPGTSEGLLEFVSEAEGDATLLLDAIHLLPRGEEDEIVIRNPSFEASGSPVGVGYIQPAAMAGWEFSSGGRGVNVTGMGPFSDNGSGLDQDSVLFIQGAVTMGQFLEGLEPGEPHTLYYYVNARNCCGEGVTAYSVAFDGELLLEEEVLPVGGNQPFHLRYLTFEPLFSDGLLEFTTTPQGDHTLLLDDLHLVKGEFVPPTPLPPDVRLTVAAGEEGSVVLSWPTAAASFELQQTASLTGAWEPVGETVVIEGDNQNVTLQTDRNALFFRLWAP